VSAFELLTRLDTDQNNWPAFKVPIVPLALIGTGHVPTEGDTV
jgi:hypothetical protein